MGENEIIRRWEAGGEYAPVAWNGIAVSVGNPGLDGKAVLTVRCEYDHSQLRWPPFLACRLPNLDMTPGVRVAIRFQVKGNKGSSIALLITENAPDSKRLAEGRRFTLDGEWQTIEYETVITGDTGKNILNVPRITLHGFAVGDIFLFSPITLERIKI